VLYHPLSSILRSESCYRFYVNSFCCRKKGQSILCKSWFATNGQLGGLTLLFTPKGRLISGGSVERKFCPDVYISRELWYLLRLVVVQRGSSCPSVSPQNWISRLIFVGIKYDLNRVRTSSTFEFIDSVDILFSGGREAAAAEIKNDYPAIRSKCLLVSYCGVGSGNPIAMLAKR